MKKIVIPIVILLIIGVVCFAAKFIPTQEAILKIRLMETTDLHCHIMAYDYFRDAEDHRFGFAKTATLIRKARAEVKNSMLFDNGDTLQGNPFSDYVARVRGLKKREVHPMFKAMNLLNYDVGAIGNHEFNYGLDFLKRSLKGANFPYISGNCFVYSKKDTYYFEPYKILTREFVDAKGKKHKIRVGVMGFVPPAIVLWDKQNLEGKLITKDVLKSAKKIIQEIRQKKVDLLIVLSHGGLDEGESEYRQENSAYHLAKLEGVDALFYGHTHEVFPKKEGEFKVHGVPCVSAGFWGSHLGIIDLTLKKKGATWQVIDSNGFVRPIYKKEGRKVIPLVSSDEEVVKSVTKMHNETLKYIRGPVGKTTSSITSYFALVQDNPAVQIINNAQMWYVKKMLRTGKYANIPVISAAAPFKAGSRGGPEYYTSIAKGTIAIKNVADLYLYPNTLKAVLINGAGVKEWLEMSAGQFFQVDPNHKDKANFINDAYATYNFDIIDGVTYQIDVTKPPKYDDDGKLINKDTSRIVNLCFQGKPINLKQKFIVVTNNYRAAGGGNFPGLDGSNVIFDSPDEVRQIIINYIMHKKIINPSADGNWKFVSVPSTVSFLSTPRAKEHAKKHERITYKKILKNGFAKYEFNLR